MCTGLTGVCKGWTRFHVMALHWKWPLVFIFSATSTVDSLITKSHFWQCCKRVTSPVLPKDSSGKSSQASTQNWKTKPFMGRSLPPICEARGGLTENVQEGQAKGNDSLRHEHHWELSPAKKFGIALVCWPKGSLLNQEVQDVTSDCRIQEPKWQQSCWHTENWKRNKYSINSYTNNSTAISHMRGGTCKGTQKVCFPVAFTMQYLIWNDPFLCTLIMRKWSSSSSSPYLCVFSIISFIWPWTRQ